MPPACGSRNRHPQERCVSRIALVCLAGRQLLAAEILGGRRVGIRIEPATLMFYDLATRELLRTRKNPLTPEQVKSLRGVRPATPPPRPSAEPIQVQRRASNTGVIMVVGQKIALGSVHKHQTVTVPVSETTPHRRVRRRRCPGHPPDNHPAGA